MQKEAIAESIKGIKILVTEDNETNKKLIEAALNLCQLDFADSGEQSITMASEKKYDLILMDIQLPGMDGITAMRQIKKNDNNNVPIVAMTAFAMKNDDKKYLNKGFDDYISKPINIKSMMTKIITLRSNFKGALEE